MTYQRPAGGDALRLHLNERIDGCSPAVLRAIHALSPQDLAVYPDYDAVTADVAAHFAVPTESVLVTNGLDEGLLVAAQAARLRAGGPFDAIVIEPAFEMYAIWIAAVGARLISVPSGPDFAFPGESALDAVSDATGLIYVCDPNNPSGQPVPDDALAALARRAPGAIVLVDEAYADFSGRTVIGRLLRQHPNLVVGRTFAKAHGLAGLRAGALVASPGTVDRLRPFVPPYSLNVCAAVALRAALSDRGHVERYLVESQASRALIHRTCRALGLRSWPSEANFVLLKAGPRAKELVAFARGRGVLIRDRSETPGCAGCVRITAGRLTDTEQAMRCLEAFYAPRAD